MQQPISTQLLDKSF